MGRRFVAAVVVVIVGAALGTAVRARDNDKLQAAAVQNATVNFGQAQVQTPDPAPVGAAVTHFLDPNEVTIHKNGTVTFVVNGGGHGIAIHPVSKDTTREDIAQDLCDGATAENPDRVVDRRTRAAVCNGTAATNVVINGTPVTVIGTQNLNYTITDGKGNLIIEPGFNVTVPTTPPTVLNNPRLDDMIHTDRLLATSGRPPAGESAVTALNAAGLATAGAFLTGSASPVAPATVGAPGNRIQVRFARTGRYLVICMNRAHSLNDHMFGFVNVVDDGDNEQ